MKLHAALVLVLLVLSARAEDEHEQDDSHDLNGISLRFISKAPKFQFAPSGDNSSWVRVEFGSVYEKTDAGQKLAVHSIDSLAAATPLYTTGKLAQLSGLGQVYSSLLCLVARRSSMNTLFHVSWRYLLFDTRLKHTTCEDVGEILRRSSSCCCHSKTSQCDGKCATQPATAAFAACVLP
jgi:hypothetical protein